MGISMRVSGIALAAAVMAGPSVAQTGDESWAVVGVKGGYAMAWESLGVKKDAEANSATLSTFRYVAEGQRGPVGRYHFTVEDMIFSCSDGSYKLGRATMLDINLEVLFVGDMKESFKVDSGTLNAVLEGIACRGELVTKMSDLSAIRNVTKFETFAMREQAMVAAKAMAQP